MPLYVEESYVNVTKGVRYGESGLIESFDTPGEIYRACLGEYGRCIGRMYIDRTDGGVQHVGWVFQKRVKYDDSRDTYLREVWVSVHTAPDTVTREQHFASLGH